MSLIMSTARKTAPKHLHNLAGQKLAYLKSYTNQSHKLQKRDRRHLRVQCHCEYTSKSTSKNLTGTVLGDKGASRRAGANKARSHRKLAPSLKCSTTFWSITFPAALGGSTTQKTRHWAGGNNPHTLLSVELKSGDCSVREELAMPSASISASANVDDSSPMPPNPGEAREGCCCAPVGVTSGAAAAVKNPSRSASMTCEKITLASCFPLGFEHVRYWCFQSRSVEYQPK